MDKTIKSKTFILRPYKKGDKKSLVKNINDKDIYKNTLRIPYPYNIKNARQFISKNLNERKNKSEINFAIDINGEVVGGIGFRDIEKHKAEIGYWLGKKYWGKGIATEAVKLVTNFGFKKLHLKRIYATVFLRNKASISVLEKNCYKNEGLMSKFYLKDGKLLDVMLYAKIR